MDSGNRTTLSGKRVRTATVRNSPERHCGDGRGQGHSTPTVNPLASRDGSSRAFQRTASACTSASPRPLPGTVCRPAPRSKGSSSTIRIHMAIRSCQCSHARTLTAACSWLARRWLPRRWWPSRIHGGGASGRAQQAVDAQHPGRAAQPASQHVCRVVHAQIDP